MKNLKSLLTMLSILTVLVCVQVAAFGQGEKNKLATLAAGGSSVRWDVAASHAGGTLTVSSPDGRVFSQQFKVAGRPISISPINRVSGCPTDNTITNSA